MSKDKSVQLLRTIRGKEGQGTLGLKIVRVTTTEPDPITFMFEGTKLQLDLDIFEVPVDCYPLRKDDKLLAYPLVSTEAGQRWAIATKLTGGGVTLATMQSADSLKVDGVEKVYGSTDLVLPSSTLAAGDTVSIAPTWDAAAAKIKYVIIERH